MRRIRLLAYGILDGTLIPIERVADRKPYYSGKHQRHGGNVQVIADAAGRFIRASPARLGARPDLPAARTHSIIDALTSEKVMTFADKGYQGARGSVRTPFKRRFRPKLSRRQKAVNRAHSQCSTRNNRVARRRVHPSGRRSGASRPSQSVRSSVPTLSGWAGGRLRFERPPTRIKTGTRQLATRIRWSRYAEDAPRGPGLPSSQPTQRTQPQRSFEASTTNPLHSPGISSTASAAKGRTYVGARRRNSKKHVLSRLNLAGD